MPPLEYGRIAAQSAKQVIVQKVREAERDRQYAEYKDRIGDIVNGIVKRVEYGNVVVDLGRGEAIVRRDEMLPREVFRNGDRIRAYIYDVRREPRGPQIFLSRTHPQFTAKLFAQEVPEIYDGIVEVKAVARDPGSRAKIAVISRDSSVDPVGACVGMRGSRVQAVVNELQGEKIDIIPWSPDIATFVVNALAPAEVAKVVLDEDKERIEVVVPDQQLSLAIGRRGQNVRLASQLTGWDIDILTEQEESERRQAEFENRTKIFVEALNLDEVVGQLLASEGFGSIEELALVDEKEIAGIEGFDDETARELQERAKEYLDKQEAELDAKRKELGVEDALKDVPGVTTKMLVALGENGVKTVEDLAGCATDDLTGWTERKDGETKHEPGFLDGFDVSREDAEAMIMQARLKAGWVTEAELAPPPRRRSGAGRSRTAAGLREHRQQRCWQLRRTASSTAGRPASPRGRSAPARSPARSSRSTEMIRFVVGPGRRGGARRQAQTARPRHLDHRDPRRDRGCGQAQRVRPRLQAGCAGRPRSGGADRTAAGTRRARCAGDRRQGRRVVGGFAKVEAALGRDDVLALIHAADAARRRKAQAGCRLAPQYERKIARNRGHRRVYRRPIGFGIEPAKCGTCSPACRPRKRDFSCARLRV